MSGGTLQRRPEFVSAVYEADTSDNGANQPNRAASTVVRGHITNYFIGSARRNTEASSPTPCSQHRQQNVTSSP